MLHADSFYVGVRAIHLRRVLATSISHASILVTRRARGRKRFGYFSKTANFSWTVTRCCGCIISLQTLKAVLYSGVTWVISPNIIHNPVLPCIKRDVLILNISNPNKYITWNAQTFYEFTVSFILKDLNPFYTECYFWNRG